MWESEQRKRQANAEATADAVQPRSQQQANPQLQMRRYTEVEAQPIEWLWEGKIPLGMLTILAGPGAGAKVPWPRERKQTDFQQGVREPRGACGGLEGQSTGRCTRGRQRHRTGGNEMDETVRAE
ncbi:MAG: hypothetical protein ACQESR_14605 [Planctomycetota bacterium]